MILVVPFVGELRGEDVRLIQLAEFLGVRCQPLMLPTNIRQHGEYLAGAVPVLNSCFVVNSRVMRTWLGGTELTKELVACLTSRFTHLIVHGLRPTTFDAKLVSALSRGRFHSVKRTGESNQYEFLPHSENICGPFAGLTFGPTRPANDHVLSSTGDNGNVSKLISIGGRPFMASIRLESTDVMFLASEDVADLDAEVGNAPLSVYFSRLLPYAMAFRYVFAEECWRPSGQHAALIIDDPLLQNNYGFLNFESLYRLMDRHRFHTTIAFIPHNYKRSSPQTIRMFREHVDKFGICFHGNDHTGGELASSNAAQLNMILSIAEHRMHLHRQITGLDCDRVMVFPQGKFSVEAMRILKARNYYAAVNTVPHPMGDTASLTIRELAQPALLRYGGFPLFLRKSIRETQKHDIAFNLFFGRPVFIVDHHDVFQHPESLAEVADKINSVAPGIHWSNLGTAVSRSTLIRCSSEGVHHVRAYSNIVQVPNHTSSSGHFSIEWRHTLDLQVPGVLQNGSPVPCVEFDGSWIRVSVDLDPGVSNTYAVAHRNEQTSAGGLGFCWATKAFLRRRLSEIRDNQLSRSPRVLAAANTVRRHLLYPLSRRVKSHSVLTIQ
jgi:hypothetical protein